MDRSDPCNPDSFAFPLTPGIEVAVAPKDNENLNIKTMPYQGCGPMYENLPHHCPMELFKACCSTENQKPNIAECLQNKLDRYEKEMNVKYNLSEKRGKKNFVGKVFRKRKDMPTEGDVRRNQEKEKCEEDDIENIVCKMGTKNEQQGKKKFNRARGDPTEAWTKSKNAERKTWNRFKNLSEKFSRSSTKVVRSPNPTVAELKSQIPCFRARLDL